MFYLVSDLKANFSKNRFGAIGLDVSIVAQCVELLNCKLHLLSFLYVGILIDANSMKKLFSWKQNISSISRRVCLINSVLSSLAIFFLSTKCL